MTDTDDNDATPDSSKDDDFKVIRANALRGGEVVYLVVEADSRRWSPSIADASVYRDAEVDAALKLAEKDIAGNLVVGAEAIEITGKHEPVGAKETIRAAGGPTIKYGEDALRPDYSI